MMTGLAERGREAAEALRAAGETVVVAESSTGGLISASLLAVPGASAYYRGGSVIYTLEARRTLLGISRADVAGLEPLTEAMAARFAEVARRRLDATWAVVELGVAGPTRARYGHDPGLCVLAVDGPRPCSALLETGSADRETNMWRFADAALALLARAVTAAG